MGLSVHLGEQRTALGTRIVIAHMLDATGRVEEPLFTDMRKQVEGQSF